jgi:transcriptional/translational regulatory protein YebC/TACO1
MGPQWLQAKREVANLRKGAVVGKLTKEIAVAAKLGGPDSDSNAQLFAAVEKARKNSVTRDAVERAIKKGAGIGDEKTTMEHIVFEGYAPHKVAVIVEVLTDNNNRTAPEIRILFKKAQFGTPGSKKFLSAALEVRRCRHRASDAIRRVLVSLPIRLALDVVVRLGVIGDLERL